MCEVCSGNVLMFDIWFQRKIPSPVFRRPSRCPGRKVSIPQIRGLEVEVSIHMFGYVEDRPDGYVVLINEEEDPPRADAMRILEAQ